MRGRGKNKTILVAKRQGRDSLPGVSSMAEVAAFRNYLKNVARTPVGERRVLQDTVGKKDLKEVWNDAPNLSTMFLILQYKGIDSELENKLFRVGMKFIESAIEWKSSANGTYDNDDKLKLAFDFLNLEKLDKSILLNVRAALKEYEKKTTQQIHIADALLHATYITSLAEDKDKLERFKKVYQEVGQLKVHKAGDKPWDGMIEAGNEFKQLMRAELTEHLFR